MRNAAILMQQSIKTGYFFFPTKFGIMKSREIGAHISKVKKKKKTDY